MQHLADNVDGICPQLAGFAVQFPELLICVNLHHVRRVDNLGSYNHPVTLVQGFLPEFVLVVFIHGKRLNSLLYYVGLFTRQVADADHPIAAGIRENLYQLHLTVDSYV